MTDTTVEGIADELRKLPPKELAAVHDFVGYLRYRPSSVEDISLAVAGVDDYLSNLEDYENRLARGDIRWE